MMASIFPGPSIFTAGTQTWASTLPTLTAVPSTSPVKAAAALESPPARRPSGVTGQAYFSRITYRSFGCSSPKNASEG